MGSLGNEPAASRLGGRADSGWQCRGFAGIFGVVTWGGKINPKAQAIDHLVAFSQATRSTNALEPRS